MMDAFALEALMAGCVGIGIVARYRRSGSRPARIRPISRSLGRIPHRHRRATREIVELARECLDRHPDQSFAAFTARETVAKYLPETLSAYLAVPRSLRRAGRPSPDDELRRQFRTLRSGLERLREADAAAGVSRMAANGAFLEERFGSPPPLPSAPRGSSLTDFVDAIEAYFGSPKLRR